MREQVTIQQPEGKPLKHLEAINKVFDLMYEDWMDDEDKRDLVQMTLSAVGKTLYDFDDDFEQGLKNGFSIEMQLEAVKQVMANQN